MTEQFHYTTKSGAEIVLPRFGRFPVGVIRRLRSKDGVEQVFGILEAVASEETLAEIDKLEAVEFTALAEAWQADGKVSLGESSASSSS